MDRRVANLQGIIDADTRNLLALKVGGSNDGGLIDLSGLSAITTVAGVAPVAKDIPAANAGIAASASSTPASPVLRNRWFIRFLHD